MKQRLILIVLVAILAFGLSTSALAQDGGTIVFWSTETQPARAVVTQEIINQFTADTGINVILLQR